jgi:hypothetical protein
MCGLTPRCAPNCDSEDGAPQHASLIAAHARAMKEVDPSLKAFWNDNDLSPSHLKAFL